MGHGLLLLSKIKLLLEKDYPAPDYMYVLEQSLPGTNLFPDITVIDHYGYTVCVVEIGYTRPEKLSAYKEIHNIPDIRWYDKHGVLHQNASTHRSGLLIKATGKKPPSTNHGSNVLSPANAAEYIGVSTDTLARWRMLKKGPKFLKLNGFIVRYRTKDLDDYLNGCEALIFNPKPSMARQSRL